LDPDRDIGSDGLVDERGKRDRLRQLRGVIEPAQPIEELSVALQPPVLEPATNPVPADRGLELEVVIKCLARLVHHDAHRLASSLSVQDPADPQGGTGPKVLSSG
jgi:hypothetical protein